MQQRRPGDLRPQVRLPREPGAHRRHPPGGRQALPEQRLVRERVAFIQVSRVQKG